MDQIQVSHFDREYLYNVLMLHLTMLVRKL